MLRMVYQNMQCQFMPLVEQRTEAVKTGFRMFRFME